MKRIYRFLFFVSLLTELILFSHCRLHMQAEEYYCSLMAGEPTQTSVILQARLHKTDTLIDNDIQGIEGFIKFHITRDTKSKPYMESDFFHACDSNDFIAKYEFTGLRPRQKYYYKISYGKDTSNVTSSSWSSFKTLNLPGSEQSINFVMVSGIINHAFHAENYAHTVEKSNHNTGKHDWKEFQAISLLQPDFIISSGNVINIDLMQQNPLQSKDDFRRQWHQLFSIPGLNHLLSQVPVFWMKNDFDYSELKTPLTAEPVNSETSAGELAETVYCEQVPLFPGYPTIQSAYRTFRLNSDVQIWLLEGLGYLSPESSEKSIWGEKQSDWLTNTLKESDAPFKILINPFPIIDIPKAESSGLDFTNEIIKTGRDSLFLWLKHNGFQNNGLYLISGGSKEHYHSVDPSGFEEFGCGSRGVNNNSALVFPVDSIPLANRTTIVHSYRQNSNSGGFLVVTSDRDEYNSPVLLFRFYDDQKNLLYAVKKY